MILCKLLRKLLYIRHVDIDKIKNMKKVYDVLIYVVLNIVYERLTISGCDKFAVKRRI